MALAMRAAEDEWRRAAALRSKPGRPNRTTLADFHYQRLDMTAEMRRQLERLSFEGVSGRVAFAGADRIGVSLMLQLQRGALQPVALFRPPKQGRDGGLDFGCARCVAVRWSGGQVPIARRVFKLKVRTIATEAFWAVGASAGLGIAFAVACLAFNLHFRKMK